MKIYTEVRIDINTLETTHEESYEYDGEVAQCYGISAKDREPVKSPMQQIWDYAGMNSRQRADAGSEYTDVINDVLDCKVYSYAAAIKAGTQRS